MNCAYCKHTDGVVYTSLPPKYKCAITGEYHLALDDCNVDFEPVKHGRWLIGVGENGEPIGTYCSECGWSWERNIAAIQLNKVFSRIETPRCPYCGAKMDEVGNG